MALLYINTDDRVSGTDPNADQGTDDGWATFDSARKAKGVSQSNVMPQGYEPLAKNKVGMSISDGQMSQEQLDCGYREYYLDPYDQLLTADAEKLHPPEGEPANETGFLKRNNYQDRNN